jgi:hypothetical protein
VRKRKWAGVAHAGERREEKELGWAKALGCFLSSFFSFFFFFTLTIQTKPFGFKQI